MSQKGRPLMPQKNVALKGVPFDSRIANINHMSYNVKDKKMEEKIVENKKYEISVKEILNITNGKLLIGNEQSICEKFERDSRNVKEDDIYLGIKGENLNGSIYFEQAFEKGAKGAILQDIEITEKQKEKYKNKFIILVEDTIKAMQQIATYKREKYNIPVVAITGSVGKTSTKDMVANVINQKFNTLKTEGNYNNHIGVPLTIFRLKNEEALTIEIGMNHFGEIRTLTKIAKPTVCVITNIGTAHIGNLGSRENILKAKLEILEGMEKSGTVVINNDNDLLHKWYLENKNKYKIITYGIKNESDFSAENIESKEDGSTYTLKGTNTKIHVPVGGNHFVLNSLCGVAVGSIFEIPIEKIKQGIESFELTKKRMDITKTNENITIINDAYNANYDSMKAALEYLGKIENKRKIAVLGDMLELGEYSRELHEKVGKEVVKNKIDILITVGKEAKYIANIAKINMEKQNVIECESNEETVNILNKIKKENDCILFKASNGMNFGKIIEKINHT